MNINFMKINQKKSLLETFVGITDENLKQDIIFYETQVQKSKKLKELKVFLEREGLFQSFINKQICDLYERQILSAEHILKDIIKDLYNVYKKDALDETRIKVVKNFESLLDYYKTSLFYYESVIQEGWDCYSKAKEKSTSKGFNINDVKDFFIKNKNKNK